ncbi:uncharacterized protein LOC105186933 [Harpegnathos saltator]|uniref:Transthyretin/hydroxyisourate hydrolase domain-containing protein n=1 Tax=Harpegnathos saltator TaxID=610380 RepID=E2BVD2_HARSA|nr:uncharacterized protein LOC105186933 [Harpegnathos saltator]EFN80424.1 hypothetical protein EAI_14777 [Harpegnathos saltator]
MDFSPCLKITTTITDICTGIPVFQVPIILFKFDSAANNWLVVAISATGVDGSCTDLTDNVGGSLGAGLYKILYDVKGQFQTHNIDMPLFGIIEVVFFAKQPYDHYNFRLLVSSTGYFVFRNM